LIDGVRDGLRDWLWGQLIRLGLKVLVELSTPLVGEVIAIIQAVYAAVQTFLQYESTLKEVFGTFADLAEHKDAATAIRIGQGVIGPKLVSLIVPALDFLAGLFGLGKIADGVQHVLQAARSKVDHALTPLIAALADAVRGVAGGHGHDGQAAPGTTPHQDNPKHETIAQAIVAKLEHGDGAPKDFAATRAEKEGEARPLKARYQPQLERGINLSITFATKPDDAGGKETLDFTVVIAPNTTRKSGHIPVEAPAGAVLTHVTHTLLSGGRAGSVSALPLTKWKGNTTGSIPFEAPPGWADVSRFDHARRRINPVQYAPQYWRKLHLLNQDFHGPGESWNLVPGHEVDNSWMRDHPEAQARTAINNNETLYYDSEATYFGAGDWDRLASDEERAAPLQDRVTLTNFAASIMITWGKARSNGHGGWLKDTVVFSQTHTLVKPPLVFGPDAASLLPDIKTAGRDVLTKNLGLDYGLAKQIVAERGEKGAFTDKDDFVNRMEARYISLDRSERFHVDFKTTPGYWPAIEALIVAKKATI